MKDLIFKHWQTTLIALVSFLTMMLGTYGVITPNETTDVNSIVGQLIIHVKEIAGLIMTLTLIFRAKDHNK